MPNIIEFTPFKAVQENSFQGQKRYDVFNQKKQQQAKAAAEVQSVTNIPKPSVSTQKVSTKGINVYN